jgi:hypothetical protein
MRCLQIREHLASLAIRPIWRQATFGDTARPQPVRAIRTLVVIQLRPGTQEICIAKEDVCRVGIGLSPSSASTAFAVASMRASDDARRSAGAS